MAVKIGSARIDERGKAYGGKAGDQTGREVSTQDWYLHSKGWRVFRAKDPAAAEKIARAMQAACDNRRVGYDQWQRNTLYEAAKKVDFDIAKVEKDVETDCSALVRTCCAYAGILGLPSDFRTGNMPQNLMKTGAFDEMKGEKYTRQSAYLRRGDILVTATSGHTVVALSDGAKAGEDARVDGPRVAITGGTVNVRAEPGLSGAILGVARCGACLAYRGERRADDRGVRWLRVAWGSGDGWVSEKYGRLCE